MSTNNADMGQFNILYHLNMVIDGGSRDVMYWNYFIPDPDPNFPIVDYEKDFNSKTRSLSRSSVQTDSPI